MPPGTLDSDKVLLSQKMLYAAFPSRLNLGALSACFLDMPLLPSRACRSEPPIFPELCIAASLRSFFLFSLRGHSPASRLPTFEEGGNRVEEKIDAILRHVVRRVGTVPSRSLTAALNANRTCARASVRGTSDGGVARSQQERREEASGRFLQKIKFDSNSGSASLARADVDRRVRARGLHIIRGTLEVQSSRNVPTSIGQHLEPGGHVCSGFFFSLLGCAVLPVTSLVVGRGCVAPVAPGEACPGAQLAPAGQVASGF